MYKSCCKTAPYTLEHVIDQYKTQKMSGKTAEEWPNVLRDVPDWFLT